MLLATDIDGRVEGITPTIRDGSCVCACVWRIKWATGITGTTELLCLIWCAMCNVHAVNSMLTYDLLNRKRKHYRFDIAIGGAYWLSAWWMAMLNLKQFKHQKCQNEVWWIDWHDHLFDVHCKWVPTSLLYYKYWVSIGVYFFVIYTFFCLLANVLMQLFLFIKFRLQFGWNCF